MKFYKTDIYNFYIKLIISDLKTFPNFLEKNENI